jgi:transcriptional regulator with XRE-family HTH domain
MKIIDTIYEARMKKGFTQAEFARMVGISQPHYSQIEAGKIKPGLDLLERMLFKLNLKVVPRTHKDVEL